ncbi:hypothetical protein [Nitrosopumilus piranensis]|uniref:Uncharacterized protein n=1 Tax=Nitrosopumilus piranensis TaxID=1582439 RepID=A0A0C5BQX4_9ARCH|nr:hypothetical protein [Nitrosopumilus piranensis]AJM92153.1 hypothetical protein NPIRD3C_0941 [Nitrosopumilus piranensis]
MPGLDNLIAKSLEEIIRKNLGQNTVKKIEDRLFEKYGISFTQAMEEFDKLDLVLREFFGKGADGLERKFFENIFQSKSKSKEGWYILRDEKMSQMILQSFGDLEKKAILESVAETPKIISEIIEDCNLSQTSGYRKINNLIDNGLLYKAEQISRDNKKINKYLCAFSNLRINLEGKRMSVELQLMDSEKSLFIKAIRF